jgi:hypothetical protein
MHSLCLTLLLAIASPLIAAEVAMTPAGWDVPATAEFRTHKGRSALEIKSGIAILKDTVFRNGTIEFDLEPAGAMGPGVGFRRRDAETYEYFYVRPGAKGPTAWDGCQYAPVSRGVLMWDLLPQHQAAVDLRASEWNHIKLVVSGARLNVFVNGKASPNLAVSALLGDSSEGGVLLQGPGIFSNLAISPDRTEGLSPQPEPDPSAKDNRFVRHWELSGPFSLGPSQELSASDLPGPQTVWQKMGADRGGLMNLTRRLGQPAGRPVAWLRTTIRSNRAQTKRASIGWNDEVWVFVNGQLVFSEKNLYRKPELRKNPEGRCSLENGLISIPLQKGDNEVVVALAKEIFSWGLILRFDDVNDLRIR